jgi:hypothetical protein
VGVRNVVRNGRINSTRSPSVVEAGTGLSCNVRVNQSGSSGPTTSVTATFSSGGLDYLETITTDVFGAWQGLQQNTVNYLYAQRQGAGNIAYASTPIPPSYGQVFQNAKYSLLRFENADGTTLNAVPPVDDYANTWAATATSPTYSTTANRFKFGTSSARVSGGAYNMYNASLVSIPNTWTAEAWFAFNALPGSGDSVNLFKWVRAAGASAGFGMSLNLKNTTGTITLALGLSSNGATNDIIAYTGAGIGANTTWVTTAGTFYHIAVVFTGTQYLVFVNGVIDIVVASTTKILTTAAPPFSRFYIGYTGAGVINSFDGWVDDFRFSPGAIYTYNFTPSATDLLGNAMWFDTVNYTWYLGSPMVCNLPAGACTSPTWGPPSYNTANNVFIGEAITTGTCAVGGCTSAAGAISGTPITYAFNRTWDSGWFGVVATTGYEKYHNLGIPDYLIEYKVSGYYRFPDQAKPIPIDLTATNAYIFQTPTASRSAYGVRIYTGTNPVMDEANAWQTTGNLSISARGTF